MEQKEQNMQINVSFPLKTPIQDTGARCVLLVLSFCTQGNLSNSEHMLG
jgi:hypothetical protein